MSTQPLAVVHELPILPKRAPAEPSALEHRNLRRGTWWQHIAAYKTVDEATFLDDGWQSKSSITKVSKLVEAIQELVPAGFVEDLEEGMKRAPMSVRVSPYLVSLIDWEHPYEDPLRIQFFPLASRLLAGPSQARPGLARRAGRRAGARAHAPLLGQGSLPPARHLPGLLPLLHALVRNRARYRRGREGAPASQRGTLAEGLPVHRVAPGARGHRHQRGRRVPAARAAHRRRLAMRSSRSPTCGACASRRRVRP